jgi:hypothetical protein
VNSRGNYLECLRTGGEDVYMQRNLAGLGLLVAWLQVHGSSLSSMDPEEGRVAFLALLEEACANPL